MLGGDYLGFKAPGKTSLAHLSCWSLALDLELRLASVNQHPPSCGGPAKKKIKANINAKVGELVMILFKLFSSFFCPISFFYLSG
ncbi:hypothetical protein BJX65DRAFT_275235 [Aspergillus insuetus]